MWYRRYGEGPRVYLGIHGWSGSHEAFEPLLPWMPEDVSLFSVDLPGYGRSPASKHFQLDDIRRELLALLEQIDAPTVTLFGNCSGALLGLYAALAAPERFERFVMIDVFGYLPWYFKLFLAPMAGPVLYYSTFANPIGRFLTNAGLKNNRAKDTDMVGSFRESRHSVVYRYLRLMSEVPSIEAFSPLRVPTMMLHGQRTFDDIRKALPMWQSLWPHMTAHELQGAGHLPMQEAPEQLARLAFSQPGSLPKVAVEPAVLSSPA